MNQPTKPKVPPKLVLTSLLSGGFTIALSLLYIILSILALLFRHNCNTGTLNVPGDKYFWTTIYKAYIQAASCGNVGVVANITSEHTVFVFCVITLCISALCFATAVALVTLIRDEQMARFFTPLVIAYIGCGAVALVVDLTIATHFGLDYSYLGSLLGMTNGGTLNNYPVEILRQGAFLLMSIALKGYVAPIINLVLLVLIAVYLVQYQKQSKIEEHSIHKLGTLNAFDTQVVESFNQEEPPRTPRREQREPARTDYFPNRPYDRSDSWQPAQPSFNHGARPFSYLEDIKRPVPTKPPALPSNDSSWNRDSWASSPPVPAPDYSPPARRLKSALKPAYM